ncbi:MAG: type II toxin-antitoxin system Phd/YefM family antitoxin [Bacteroidetes bacterium]|nr:type II toxin-antitoxin system Phd/YefM family antitoxin [Bacteroidota bacterium]
MITVNVHEAKTQLSSLLASVEKGEEVVIARNGTPVAQLVLYTSKRTLLGCAEGTVAYMSSDFNEPLTDFDPYQ